MKKEEIKERGNPPGRAGSGCDGGGTLVTTDATSSVEETERAPLTQCWSKCSWSPRSPGWVEGRERRRASLVKMQTPGPCPRSENRHVQFVLQRILGPPEV